MRLDEAGELIEPVILAAGTNTPPAERQEQSWQAGRLLLALAVIAGVVVMALDLAQQVRLVRIARVVLAAVGSFAIAGKMYTSGSDRAEPHPVTAVVGVAVATLFAAWAAVAGGSVLAGRAAFLAGTVLAVVAADLWLLARVKQPIRELRRRLRWSLDGTLRRVVAPGGSTGVAEATNAIGRGDLLGLEAGDRVAADVEVTRGEASVLPWPGADKAARRQVGDVVVAGSEIVSGQLQGRCLWVGDDRALARPLLNDHTRADVGSRVPRLARQIVERWVPVGAALSAVLLWLLGWRVVDVCMLVTAGYAACGAFVVAALVPSSVARAARTALERGIVHGAPGAWDSAASVSAAVFCARGTLVKGEPELVEVERFAKGSETPGLPEEALALAAGATAGQPDPVAVALRRAARQRGVAVQPARNPRTIEGRGVTAVAPAGEALCVGDRAMLLDQGVAIAAAEQRVYDLEQLGRTVVLVARGGRLLGLLGLQDGLRSGARAAVQHLLDVGVEPVLMSPDTRDTCEALGRALDIDHLRAAVAEGQTAAAVGRIRDTGAAVAVLGHPSHDGAALAAADVSVALATAGAERDDFDITLVSDDVRDASFALALAIRARRNAIAVLLLVLGPALGGTAVAAVGLLPVEYAPLAQLVGAVVASWQLLASDAPEG